MKTKTKAKKFTFKMDKPPTGLARVVFNAGSDIKLDGKCVGRIAAPSWNSKTYNYKIMFMVLKEEPDDNPNCNWKWITLKFCGCNIQECKDFVNEKFAIILQTYPLRKEED